MKINGNDEIIKSATTNKSQKHEQNQNTDFKDILRESVERTAQIIPEVRTAALLNPVSEIRLNPLSAEYQNDTVDRVDHFLKLLDNYRQQLADPRVTLRSIEPVINSIIKEKDQLSSVYDSLPKEDGLKDILNRTLITASLEIVKYQRGDYITD